MVGEKHFGTGTGTCLFGSIWSFNTSRRVCVVVLYRCTTTPSLTLQRALFKVLCTYEENLTLFGIIEWPDNGLTRTHWQYTCVAVFNHSVCILTTALCLGGSLLSFCSPPPESVLCMTWDTMELYSDLFCLRFTNAIEARPATRVARHCCSLRLKSSKM